MSEETAEQRRIADQIAEIFNGFARTCEGEKYIIEPGYREEDKAINLPRLMKVAELLGAAPDELMFNMDMRDDGYCETCSSPYEVLIFWREVKA